LNKFKQPLADSGVCRCITTCQHSVLVGNELNERKKGCLASTCLESNACKLDLFTIVCTVRQVDAINRTQLRLDIM
jgi:hypothetical protein